MFPLNNMSPMVSSIMQNPDAFQQVAALIPTMLPLLPQMLSSMFVSSPPSVSFSAPRTPVVQQLEMEDGQAQTEDFYAEVESAPICSSVSTNTLIDAKDASTEMALSAFLTQTTQTVIVEQPGIAQTTQTQQNPSITQTTQTQQNPSATQTTQTVIMEQPSITQTTQTLLDLSTQTTQTQQNPSTTQTTQTPFDFLIGTRFGGLVDQLQELGFTDKERCVRALVKHGGNMSEVVDELLLDQLMV